MARGGSAVKFTAVAEELERGEVGVAQAPGKRRRLALRMVGAGRPQIFYPEGPSGGRGWGQGDIGKYDAPKGGEE